MKHHRGGGLNMAWARDEWWPVFNRNEEVDVTIARRSAQTTALLESWLHDEELRLRHGNCCELYGAHIRALMQNVDDPSPGAQS